MTDPTPIGAVLPDVLAQINPDRLVPLKEAARQTGLSADEIKDAFLAGHIAGREKRQRYSGRVHAYEVVLSSAIAYQKHLVALDAQNRATTHVISNLSRRKYAS